MRCLPLLLLLAAAAAFARPKAAVDPRIELHDLPNTNGEWQEGVAIIAAPQQWVRYWLTDYANWPKRFPDMAWSQVLPDDARGHHVIRFHSRIAGMSFVVHESVAPDLLVFWGTASSIYTQGRIYMIDLGGGRTRVLMQSTASVHGALGLFTTKGYRRKSAFRVTASHLTALLTLAEAREKMIRYRLIILDLDGTLIDSAPDLCTAVGLALADFGLPPPGVEDVRRMVGDGQRVLIERALRHVQGDPAPKAEIVDAVLARYRFHYGRHLVERTVLYPGVAQTLTTLARETALCVATNKPGEWARQITDRLGLRPYLRLVLGEDDVGRRKPDPLLLYTLCKRLAVPVADALLCGDSLIDARTAQAAAMDLALCTYGYADPAAVDAFLAAPAPRHTVYRLDAFPQLLSVGHGTIEGP